MHARAQDWPAARVGAVACLGVRGPSPCGASPFCRYARDMRAGSRIMLLHSTRLVARLLLLMLSSWLPQAAVVAPLPVAPTAPPAPAGGALGDPPAPPAPQDVAPV